MSKVYFRLGIGLVAIIITIMMVIAMFDLKPVLGNQRGVLETWHAGVSKQALTPRTYWVLPHERVYVYDVGQRVFERNDKSPHGTYLVQSKDNQDMTLSFRVRWHLDPAKVVYVHQEIGEANLETNILNPTLERVVKDNVTTKEALDAYSGEGLVKLQQDIEKELQNEKGSLKAQGIVVDEFVMQHIGLDPDYTKEIVGRQIAIQKEMRSIQEEKAAQADALKAKAIAQADLNTKVVEAEGAKQVKVLEAEAENETAILKAEAEKQKVVLAAEAKKESGELEAASILAIGKAEAESEKMKMNAYSVDGSDVYAKIEIAKSMGQAFSNIKGYLPEDMQIFTLGESFTKAVENVVGKNDK